ncbi:hypothetical protein GDO86_016583 [Hymenochirus boettgeri]|uniref:Uncharacterized protein n=1 Tax=Hymenochirus boettgeri TaxID=247094 RepID=A0A8T2K023_9PIPI|nr:hypothetical protein GDO86_016583 [Hymenochirus boettgeri]
MKANQIPFSDWWLNQLKGFVFPPEISTTQLLYYMTQEKTTRNTCVQLTNENPNRVGNATSVQRERKGTFTVGMIHVSDQSPLEL